MRTDIIIVSYNRLELTTRTIQWLYTRTPLESFRLILVDNASTDGTAEYLAKTIGNMGVLIRLSQNVGLQEAKNIGMRFVMSERFVDSDNDILVPELKPDWLTQLNSLMDRNPEFAAIALRPQILVGVGAIFAGADEVKENNVVGGSMRMMNTKAVREVGGWDNGFENTREEWNICGRLQKAGWKVGYSRDLRCNHLFSEDGHWGYGDKEDLRHPGRTCAYKDSMFDLDHATFEPLTTRYNE